MIGRPLQQAGSSSLGWRGAETALKVYLVLLLALPQQLVIGAIGFVGSPANLWGLGCLGAWIWYHLNRTSRIHESGTVRAGLLLLGVVLTSYLLAMRSPVTPAEINLADGSLLRLASWLGVVFLAVDGLADAGARRRVLAWFCAMTAALAALSLLQTATGQVWVDRLSVPGLEMNSSVILSGARNGMVRASATSTHAIEFGQLMTMGTVLSCGLAIARGSRAVVAMAVLCGIGIFLVVSRSSVISVAVAMAILVPVLSSRQRWAASLGGVGVVLAVFMMRPGLLGTLVGTFTGVTEDPSALSRTNSWEFATTLIAQRPLLGRGLGTLLTDYRILDNQWLVLAVEIGLAGVAAFLAFFAVAVSTNIRAEASMCGSPERALVRGCTAAVVGGCAGMLFFDTFAFSQAAGALFLMSGLAAASFPRRTPDRVSPNSHAR